MSATTGAREAAPRNEVILVGRLSASPTVRRLPSGDLLVAWRVIVERGTGRPPGGRRVVDAFACVTFRHEVWEELAGWEAGDVVEVRGALRRRFWRGANGPMSRYEVEVLRARRVMADERTEPAGTEDTRKEEPRGADLASSGGEGSQK